MPRICNRLAREATTEDIWIVDDDIIRPRDAAESLIRGMDEDVATVAGAYRYTHVLNRGGRGVRSAADLLSRAPAAMNATGKPCNALRDARRNEQPTSVIWFMSIMTVRVRLQMFRLQVNPLIRL